MEDPAARQVIHVANLASFCVGVFGGTSKQISITDLHDVSLASLLADRQEVSDEVLKVLLAFKTLVAINLLQRADGDESAEEILQQVFQIGFEEQLRARHPESKTSSDEQDILASALTHKETLMAETAGVEGCPQVGE